MFKLTLAAAFVFAVVNVNAICPGFNYGIADLGDESYKIYDDGCNVIETDIFSSNPCTQGKFSCSPAPITITGAEINGLWYACRPDPNSGSCNGYNINVCCRNDGN
ncbi:hypothetical protein EUX98_g6233 [Antrodiella citrinella]|uniref:Cyanovirin-N domain-containing protein n=1 Tax=Antrodiella citrinella TaxID=2447956 RepID=A0A4S4MRE8_9APHY|nr:hypothetical protein EUX98_g6233 [Antrodiella citrinella]